MSNQMYRKVNDEFEEVGYEFTGFPSNGLWLVEDGKQNCLIPMGDIPKFPDPILTNYSTFQDELQKLITGTWEDKPLSVVDISKIACEFFAQKAMDKDAAQIFCQD